MKKYFKAFIIALAFVSITACEREFIEPWPPDAARTSEDIWGYYKYAKGVLDDIYARYIFCPHMNEVYGSYGMMACATDEAEHSLDNAKVQYFTNGNWNATSSPTIYYGGAQVTRKARHPWENDYLVIRKANTFLAGVDNSILIDDLDDPTRRYDRTWAKGQAYFWRAYAEFDLFRRYGRYVISTKVEEVADPELFRDRNTLEECFNQIIADCNSAIDSLPVLWDEDNWGRVNRTGAQALKSRAMLYYASPLFQGDWDTWGNPAGTVGDVDRWIAAADAARDAINDNEFYQLPLMTAGGTAPVKTKPGTNSAEGSYNYVISMADGLDNHEQIWTGERTTTASTFWERYNLPSGIEGFNGYTCPTQEMVDAFEMKTGYPFDWNNPSHVEDPYANRDPRFYATILYNGYFWGKDKNKGYYIDTYEGGVHRNTKLSSYTKTGYYHRKFLSEAWYAYKSGSYTTQKRARHEFRFAELVLNYAEALNEAYGPTEEDPNGMLRALSEEDEEGGINTALGAVNAIRARVGMPGLREEQYATQEAMREAIHHERRIELCFEGHRFYDVRRWKEGETFGEPIHGIVITPTGYDGDSRPTGFTYERVKVEDRVWEDKMYWWPIPYSEIVKYKKVGNFTQNPGWEG